MDVLQKISEQMASVGMPLFAVSLTAVPRANTPLLLMLHWHGFRKDPEAEFQRRPPPLAPVPGSALQLNEHWDALELLDHAMLDAAWRLGAWELDREERRACNTVGAAEREALECRQAFGDHPLMTDRDLIADAPDRDELMHLGARVGYVRWQFRPVKGGLWRETAVDCTLDDNGCREPPCPVPPRAAAHAPRQSHTRYRLGRQNRIVLL